MKTLKELQISRRSVVKGALLSLGYSLFGETAFGASLSKYNVVLGRLFFHNYAMEHTAFHSQFSKLGRATILLRKYILGRGKNL
jgi:hypothetical protein